VALVESQVRFIRVREKVPEKVPEKVQLSVSSAWFRSNLQKDL
jgi:hypothetical protein